MPGGVVEPPPPRTEAEIRRIVPRVDYEAVVRIATTYRIESQHDAETPLSVRETMQTIAEQSRALVLSFQMLSEESRGALFDALRPVGDVSEFIQTVEHASYLLFGAAKNAANGVEMVRGRPRNEARVTMVRQIARLIQSHGYPVNASTRGELCRVVGALLEGYQERFTQVHKVVGPALEKSL